ncbi:MAG: hypothetical protein VZR73_07045 [Acutalibacteraceae bacterium]|nr:hypothetical protein [Acutalibacteraceae bacterium]
MNNKKQLKISGFIIAIAVILVMSIVFLIAVQVPFLQQKDGFEKKHASATSKINYYNSYLSNASAIESNIASMIEEYQTKNPILYDNATKTPNEIRTVLEKMKYELTSLSIATGVADSQGRKTVEGGKLMYTSVNFRFSGTKDDLKKSLDYLEMDADGTYYIISVAADPTIESGSTTTTSTKGVAGSGIKYDFTIQMALYYFEKVEIATTSSTASAASKK